MEMFTFSLTVLSLIIIGIAFYVFIAKFLAIRGQKTEYDLFWGALKLVLWQPTEGILILRNKKIHLVDMTGKGGCIYIFPIIGDEVKARVPLGVRFLTWQDDRVLTKESLQTLIKVVVWWKVVDIEKYIFNIDRSSCEGIAEGDHDLIKPSEAWLKAITESTIRVVVSRANVAQLISKFAARYLHIEYHLDGKIDEQDETKAIAETIATNLHSLLNEKLLSYGIAIDRVEIQEIRLAQEAQDEINKVWINFLKPLQSTGIAKAKKIERVAEIEAELETSAKLFGSQQTATIEMFKQMKGMSFAYLPPFLQSLFGIVNGNIQSEQLSLPKSDIDQIRGSEEKNKLDSIYNVLKLWKENPQLGKNELGLTSKDSLIIKESLTDDEISELKETLQKFDPIRYQELFPAEP